MTKQAETITVREVYSDHDEPITVAPSGDFPGSVRVFAKGQKAQEYWGLFDVTLSVAFARELAAAILKCADEQEEKNV